jgi:NAD(P)H-hydrate epimerase
MNHDAVLSTAQMSRADALTIASGVAGVTLMENAGRGIVRAITERFAPCAVLVLCGPGNNGGDGFVVARLLQRAGWPVRLALLGDCKSLKGDAAAAAARWTGAVEPLDPGALDGVELVVDGLFGAGLTRPPGGLVAQMIGAVTQRRIPVVAIDLPSGVDGATGAIPGEAFDAVLTVTFFRKKVGHLMLPGRARCGEVRVVDIGIPDEVLETIAPQTFENTPALWRAAFPWPTLMDHKYDRGHAVVVSGGPATTGAARLAAMAALRVGAGLVSVACPPRALMVHACHLTAVMTKPFDGEEGLRELLGDSRITAAVLGPGGGVNEATGRHVLDALALGKFCVLDADALSVFADRPERLFEAIAAAPATAVLTPHGGEFARLFPDLAASARNDKLAATRAAAARAGAIVLLKGADTVIAAPDGRALINTNAPPELATAGAGDVLAGLIVGLRAQGMAAAGAAAAAAWLHGEAARRHGPGLIAEDLAKALPAVLAALKAG